MSLNGLCKINVELSSVCLKDPGCFMCGRRKRDKLYGTDNYGYMDFELVTNLARQTPSDLLVAFHLNGDPLHYPRLGDAIKEFSHCTTYFVTNGMLLLERADEIINGLDLLSISVIENERLDTKIKQLDIIKKFLEMKAESKPFTTLRFVGNVENQDEYIKLGLQVARRTLHAPEGSFNYRKLPVIPEHGICQDLLNTLAVDRFGNYSCCVRFDINGDLRLGNIKDMTLEQAWNSPKRLKIKELHIKGKRSESGFCHTNCQFYGVPTAD
jgi:hypothetical protein